jgi:hypothetical protein
MPAKDSKRLQMNPDGELPDLEHLLAEPEDEPAPPKRKAKEIPVYMPAPNADPAVTGGVYTMWVRLNRMLVAGAVALAGMLASRIHPTWIVSIVAIAMWWLMEVTHGDQDKKADRYKMYTELGTALFAGGIALAAVLTGNWIVGIVAMAMWWLVTVTRS